MVRVPASRRDLGSSGRAQSVATVHRGAAGSRSLPSHHRSV